MEGAPLRCGHQEGGGTGRAGRPLGLRHRREEADPAEGGRALRGWLRCRLKAILRRQPPRRYGPCLRYGCLAEGWRRGRSKQPSTRSDLRAQDSQWPAVWRSSLDMDGRHGGGPGGFRRLLARHTTAADGNGIGMVDTSSPDASVRAGFPYLADVLHGRSAADRAKETLERWRCVLTLYLQVSPFAGDSHPAGGSKTLENDDRRHHRHRGLDWRLLSDRRAAMAAPVLGDVEDRGIQPGSRTDADPPRYRFVASLDRGNGDCPSGSVGADPLGDASAYPRSWHGRRGGDRRWPPPLAPRLCERISASDPARGADLPASKRSVLVEGVGRAAAFPRAGTVACHAGTLAGTSLHSSVCRNRNHRPKAESVK